MPSRIQTRLDDLVEVFVQNAVIFVGVVGEDCDCVEDIIDELIVGDGSRDYDLLTSSHPGESIDDVVRFAESLTGKYSDGGVQVVNL